MTNFAFHFMELLLSQYFYIVQVMVLAIEYFRNICFWESKDHQSIDIFFFQAQQFRKILPFLSTWLNILHHQNLFCRCKTLIQTCLYLLPFACMEMILPVLPCCCLTEASSVKSSLVSRSCSTWLTILSSTSMWRLLPAKYKTYIIVNIISNRENYRVFFQESQLETKQSASLIFASQISRSGNQLLAKPF